MGKHSCSIPHIVLTSCASLPHLTMCPSREDHTGGIVKLDRCHAYGISLPPAHMPLPSATCPHLGGYLHGAFLSSCSCLHWSQYNPCITHHGSFRFLFHYPNINPLYNPYKPQWIFDRQLSISRSLPLFSSLCFPVTGRRPCNAMSYFGRMEKCNLLE